MATEMMSTCWLLADGVGNKCEARSRDSNTFTVVGRALGKRGKPNESMNKMGTTKGRQTESGASRRGNAMGVLNARAVAARVRSGDRIHH